MSNNEDDLYTDIIIDNQETIDTIDNLSNIVKNKDLTINNDNIDIPSIDINIDDNIDNNILSIENNVIDIPSIDNDNVDLTNYEQFKDILHKNSIIDVNQINNINNYYSDIVSENIDNTTNDNENTNTNVIKSILNLYSPYTEVFTKEVNSIYEIADSNYDRLKTIDRQLRLESKLDLYKQFDDINNNYVSMVNEYNKDVYSYDNINDVNNVSTYGIVTKNDKLYNIFSNESYLNSSSNNVSNDVLNSSINSTNDIRSSLNDINNIYDNEIDNSFNSNTLSKLSITSNVDLENINNSKLIHELNTNDINTLSDNNSNNTSSSDDNNINNNNDNNSINEIRIEDNILKYFNVQNVLGNNTININIVEKNIEEFIDI